MPVKGLSALLRLPLLRAGAGSSSMPQLSEAAGALEKLLADAPLLKPIRRLMRKIGRAHV